MEGGPPASPLPQSHCSAEGEARPERLTEQSVLVPFVFTSQRSAVLRVTVSLGRKCGQQVGCLYDIFLLCSFQIFISFTAVLCVCCTYILEVGRQQNLSQFFPHIY